MLKFFEDHNVKIYYTHANLKALFIERFNRSLRELIMKEFVKNNNTIWYNILPNLKKTYNNRFHGSIKMKPIDETNQMKNILKKIFVHIIRQTKYQNLKLML